MVISSRSYDLHANAYVVKPIDVGKFSDAIKQIDGFFMNLMRRRQ
jgi:two-component system response regulator